MWQAVTSTVSGAIKKREFWIVLALLFILITIILLVGLVRSPETVEYFVAAVFRVEPNRPPQNQAVIELLLREIAPECFDYPASQGCLRLYDHILDLYREISEELQVTPVP